MLQYFSTVAADEMGNNHFGLYNQPDSASVTGKSYIRATCLNSLNNLELLYGLVTSHQKSNL